MARGSRKLTPHNGWGEGRRLPLDGAWNTLVYLFHDLHIHASRFILMVGPDTVNNRLPQNTVMKIPASPYSGSDRAA